MRKRSHVGHIAVGPTGNGHAVAPARAHDPEVVVAVMASDAHERDVRELVEGLRTRDIEVSAYDIGPGVLTLTGAHVSEIDALLSGYPTVAQVFVPTTRYRLACREIWPSGSLIDVGGVSFGGESFVVVAGPCAVEGRRQLLTTARAVADAGASVLRGGAFKPRTSPYFFQGLGLHGLELLAEARSLTGLPFITEVMDPALIEPMYSTVDCFQVGARNMQNFDLLKALSDVDKPVLLKRGPAATVEEWLLAAEYLLAGGNGQVILCERGIRTFNESTRFTLDLGSVALAKRETHLPVIVDPSHATGDSTLVGPMAKAALAAGADGVIVEVHPDPKGALSDGFQALLPMEFEVLVRELSTLGSVLGRPLALPAVRVGSSSAQE